MLAFATARFLAIIRTTLEAVRMSRCQFYQAFESGPGSEPRKTGFVSGNEGFQAAKLSPPLARSQAEKALRRCAVASPR